MSIESVKQDTKHRLARTFGKQYSNIELCRIDEVDTTNKVVSAYFFESNKFLRNIPYSLPFYNSGYGIMFSPSKGSIGIACTTSRGLPYIISFTPPDTLDDSGALSRNVTRLGDLNMPTLGDGEILIDSKGHSFLYLDNLGGLMLSSSLFAYLKLDENGCYELDVEKGVVTVNDTLEEIYMTDYIPAMKIVKGIHKYFPTQDGDSSIELCYSVTMLGSAGENAAFIGLGTDNKIHIKGDIIRY